MNDSKQTIYSRTIFIILLAIDMCIKRHEHLSHKTFKQLSEYKELNYLHEKKGKKENLQTGRFDFYARVFLRWNKECKIKM